MRVVSRILLVVSLVLLIISTSGQNYIGLHKDEIKEKIRDEYPGFAFAKEVENDDRSFIKFENTFEEQTLIFVLNSKGYCTSVSRMYNTWLFNRVKDDLEKKYGKNKDLVWVTTENDKSFETELRKGEWYITVIIRQKK